MMAVAGVSGVFSTAEAQTLRRAGPPAEFPPASYRGKQYVDSRGCVYIRAGIDGNVDWVPRVSRSRQQLCGYQPTTVAGTSAARPRAASAPELITLPQSAQPTAKAPRTVAAAPAATRPQTTSQPRSTAAASAAASATAPVVVRQKPRRSPAQTSARPSGISAPAPAPVRPAPVAPAPRRVTPAPQPAQVPPAAGGCAGASALSSQYINRGAGVRCGPQSDAPVTYGTGRDGRSSSVNLTPNSRILPVHVYQERRLSEGLEVPEGYRPAWQDDRLNWHRTERTARPAVLIANPSAPSGYVRVDRKDGRLNPMRGRGSATGEAQMAQVWQDTLPRRPVRPALDRDTVRLSESSAVSNAEAEVPLTLFLSSKSTPGADAPVVAARKRYVRAAGFADPAEAHRAAQALATTGLPVRLGTSTRGSKVTKVVLAGPFTDPARAEAALQQVRAAGYSRAALTK